MDIVSPRTTTTKLNREALLMPGEKTKKKSHKNNLLRLKKKKSHKNNLLIPKKAEKRDE